MNRGGRISGSIQIKKMSSCYSLKKTVEKRNSLPSSFFLRPSSFLQSRIPKHCRDRPHDFSVCKLQRQLFPNSEFFDFTTFFLFCIPYKFDLSSKKKFTAQSFFWLFCIRKFMAEEFGCFQFFKFLHSLQFYFLPTFTQM